MMGRLLIEDLSEGERLAFLACLFMQGDLSSDEYIRQVRTVVPGGESYERIVVQRTDWDCLNRMMGRRTDLLS